MHPDDARDAASQKVLIIGDSVMRGLNRIVTKNHANNWRVDTNEGWEALGIPIEASDLEQFEHIVYVTSGNGLWKDEWKKVERNTRFLDPEKVSVVLLGTAELWHNLYGGDAKSKPKYETFFERAKHALEARRIEYVELVEYMKTLEYADSEGHPSKNARWEFAAKLVEVVKELIACKTAKQRS